VTENSTWPVAGFQCQFCASELGSRRSQPTLNQTGELKATFWLSSRWESSAKKVSASAGWRSSRRDAPVADGLGDAGDEGADAGLALGRADLAVEVLRGDDVGGGHRPVGGDLDVLLLEDGAALVVLDDGVAQLPGDLVEGRDAGAGEVAREGEAGRGEMGTSGDGCAGGGSGFGSRWLRVGLGVWIGVWIGVIAGRFPRCLLGSRCVLFSGGACGPEALLLPVFFSESSANPGTARTGRFCNMALKYL
jgi:hypothetical protein